MTSTPTSIQTTKKRTTYAQLLLVQVSVFNQVKFAQKQGTECFRSSDMYWMRSISKEWATMPFWIDGKKAEGLLDTGANVSVLSYQPWPSHWPLQSTQAELCGVGVFDGPQESSKKLFLFYSFLI